MFGSDNPCSDLKYVIGCVIVVFDQRGKRGNTTPLQTQVRHSCVIGCPCSSRHKPRNRHFRSIISSPHLRKIGMGGTACKQYFILVAIFIFRDSPERTRPGNNRQYRYFLRRFCHGTGCPNDHFALIYSPAFGKRTLLYQSACHHYRLQQTPQDASLSK